MSNPVSYPVCCNSMKKVTLPPSNQWKVAADDVVVQGNMMSMIKRKGFLWSRSSSVLHRSMTITRHGLLVIYDTAEQGYVLDLHDVEKLTTATKSLMKQKTGDFRADWTGAFNGAKRTQLKVKLRWGAVVMSVLSKDAIPWIQAISRFACGVSAEEGEISLEVGGFSETTTKKERQKILEGWGSRGPNERTKAIMDLQFQIGRHLSQDDEEVEVEMPGNSEKTSTGSGSNRETLEDSQLPQPLSSAFSPIQPMLNSPWTPRQRCSSSVSVCWRRPAASPLPPPSMTISDPTVGNFSVRQGIHSVATMKKILERRATFGALRRVDRRKTMTLFRGTAGRGSRPTVETSQVSDA